MRVSRRLWLSLSLANLLAIQLWIELFKPGQTFLIDGQESLGALAAVLLGAAAVFLAACAVDLLPARLRSHVSAAALIAAMALVLWAGIRPLILGWLPYFLGRGQMWLLAVLLVGAGVSTYLAVRHPGATKRGVTAILFVLSPYVLVTMGQVLWHVQQVGLGPNSVAHPQMEAPRLAAGLSRLRTVVLIFDEFDYEVAFADPAVAQRLVRFSALRQEPGTFFATAAYPPMHSTMMSLPAMLTGQLVRASADRREPQGDLQLTFLNGAEQAYSAAQTVFTDLRSQGRRSLRMNEMILPPMRLDGPGDADVVVPAAGRSPQGIGHHTRAKLAEWFDMLPFARSRLWDMKVLRWLGLPHPWERKEAIVAQMASLAADADSDLIFLHVLLPHKPVVFDAGRGGMGPGAGTSYRDNLIATDMALGRIVDAIKQAGRWDDTHLVVTTDHFYRNKGSEFGLGDHRIPFLVHVAGDRSAPVTFQIPFNTVLFRALVGAIARGEIKDTAVLGAQVRQAATFGESPLTEYRKGW